jgi:hypothetical protein
MIAFFISLNLSPYFGVGPIYPADGFEPPECKYEWWINLFFLNNILNADKMVFVLNS